MRRAYVLAFSAFALSGCGSSNSSSSAMPSTQTSPARVRFAEGAPLLETLIGGVPGPIGSAYLQVDGSTVASSFNYGTFTPFLNLSGGTHSLVARDTLGYAVGPIKTPALTPGGRYTLVLVGTYPNYRVLTFAEPQSSSEAQLSLYEASPGVPQADFGSFRASSYSDLKELGTVTYGNLATVTLGKSISNFGGYAATASCPKPPPPNCVTPAQIDSFDKHNALPFHAIGRLSLFLFDPKSGTTIGPVFASLDR
jgi:hypothetical protein